MTQNADLVGQRLTDAQMGLARIRPCFEVECKDCDLLLGYEPNRGEAWKTFAAHVLDVHPSSGTGK